MDLLNDDDLHKLGLTSRGTNPVIKYIILKLNAKIIKYMSYDNILYCRSLNGKIKKLCNGLLPPIPQRYVVLSRNEYALDGFKSIGGGAINHLRGALHHVRLQGSLGDMLSYIGSYQPWHITKFSLSWSDKEAIGSQILGKTTEQLYGKLLIVSYRDCVKKLTMNLSASAGVSRTLFCNAHSKNDTLLCDLAYFKLYYASILSGLNPKVQHELWQSFSRGKVAKADKVANKLHEGSSIARVISYTSMFETLIAAPLYLRIKESLYDRFFEVKAGVCIGCKRNGSDWLDMSINMSRYTHVMTADYSKFDTSITRELLDSAFEFIFDAFDKDDVDTANYVRWFRSFIESNVSSRVQLCGSSCLFELNGGVPSGSIWTSVIGSIINVINLQRIMRVLIGNNSIIGREYIFFVYGDDLLVCFNKSKSVSNRSIAVCACQVSSEIGLHMDADEVQISKYCDYNVGYQRPVYAPGDYLSNGTRDLQPLRIEYSKVPFDGFDHSKGTTHRWSYDFARRPSFLKYYWRFDGCPIRPWYETAIRLVNCESTLRHFDDYNNLLISHLYDNIYNAHARNWIYHLLYDSLHSESRSKRMQSIRSYPVKLKKNCSMFRTQVSHDDIDGESLRLSKLCNNADLLSHYTEQTVPRAFYRRINFYINTFSCPLMSSFNESFNRIVNKCFSISSTRLIHDSFVYRDSMSRKGNKKPASFLSDDYFNRFEYDRFDATKLKLFLDSDLLQYFYGLNVIDQLITTSNYASILHLMAYHKAIRLFLSRLNFHNITSRDNLSNFNSIIDKFIKCLIGLC